MLKTVEVTVSVIIFYPVPPVFGLFCPPISGCVLDLVANQSECAKMQLYPWFRCLFAMFIMHNTLGLSAYNQCIQGQQQVSCSTVHAIMGYTFLSICVYEVLHEASSYLLLCFTYIQQ